MAALSGAALFGLEKKIWENPMFSMGTQKLQLALAVSFLLFTASAIIVKLFEIVEF
jgi:hypothetical protein